MTSKILVPKRARFTGGLRPLMTDRQAGRRGKSLMIIAGAWLCSVCNPAWSQPPGVAAGPPLVAVSQVTRDQIAEEQSFLGTLLASRQAVIGSAVEGRVTALNVQPGDYIRGATAERPADILASLETEMLEIEIGAARIQFELAGQAAEELAAVLPAEIESAASRLVESRARADYARQELERLKRLASSQGTAVAPLEIDLAESQLNALNELARQADIEHERLVATRGTRLQQARLRADAAQQEVLRLEDLKNRFDVRAPFDGYVTNKFTDIGAWLAKGAPVVEVVQIDTLDFVFQVPQEVVPRLQRAIAHVGRATDNIQVALEGWPDPLTASLVSIIPQADARARTLRVRATLDNPRVLDRPTLQPGMVGRALVPIGTPRSALFVAKDALVLQGRDTVVFKIVGPTDHGVAQRVRVTTGISRGESIEVCGDLNEGDYVIVMGNERLRGGETVKIQSGR